MVTIAPTLRLIETRVGHADRDRTVNLPRYDVFVGDVKVGTVGAYLHRYNRTPYARTRRESAPVKRWDAISTEGGSATRLETRRDAVAHLVEWAQARGDI